MSSWKNLLLRIGDGNFADFKDHIEICFGVIRRELEHSADDVSQFLLKCDEQIPHKSPLYGTMVGLLNLKNEDFVKKIVENTRTNFQHLMWQACLNN